MIRLVAPMLRHQKRPALAGSAQPIDTVASVYDRSWTYGLNKQKRGYPHSRRKHRMLHQSHGPRPKGVVYL